MVKKIFNIFCALSLCFFSTPISYAKEDSHGFERLDEGVINSRAVAFHSAEATSLLSNFKEEKAEQINALRNNVNVYLPPASKIEQSNKNILKLEKLKDEEEEYTRKSSSEEEDQTLPDEVLMDLPESLPKANLKINKNESGEVHLRSPKIEGLIISSALFHSSDEGDSSVNAPSFHKTLEKAISDASSLSNGHALSRSISVSPYLGGFPSAEMDSLFVVESAPLILHLQNQELNAENLDENISEPQEENAEIVSEEATNPSLESNVQENENSFFLNPKIIPEAIAPQMDVNPIEEYEIQEAPDFSEGLGAFLRSVSEEGFFYSGLVNFEFAKESEDFSGIEEASAQCLENPADAVCQELFVVFISQPLLLESPSVDDEGLTFESFALTAEENDALMMEAGLTPEETQSASFALLTSGTNDSNAASNNKKNSSGGNNSKNAAEPAQKSVQGRTIELPLGMPDFYLPWQRAVLHDAKFVKVNAPVLEKAETESLSKVQARVAPEDSLYNVMPKFNSEDTQKVSKKADENNPLDIDFNFPLKSIFERPLPATFPAKAMIQLQHNIQVSPISSYPIQDVPMEWQIYEWFFKYFTDLYYYDWNWMIWLNQEESRFLRKLDS